MSKNEIKVMKSALQDLHRVLEYCLLEPAVLAAIHGEYYEPPTAAECLAIFGWLDDLIGRGTYIGTKETLC
jgi:hypothetical protein